MNPRLLIIHAGQLVTLAGPEGPRGGKDQGSLAVIPDGAVLIEGSEIVGVGPTSELTGLAQARDAKVLDAGGRVVLPGLVDSHSHPVFVHPRLDDFGLRVRGASYAEIVEKGGGILSSVAQVRFASEDELTDRLRVWARRFIECGTTTLEAKSGYGLNMAAELKMLRAIKRVGEEGPLELVATFLGAHAVPPEYENSARFTDYLVREVLPAVAREKLAEFADVFCEEGYFSPDDASEFLTAAESFGLKPKIHAEQFGRSGGCEVAAKVKAVSADHLDCASPQEISRIKSSGAVAVLAPGSNFFLNRPYPPARALISAGVPVALATDFNPGTCPCWNLQTVIAIACGQMRMTPEEAITAATLNGAYACGRGAKAGSLEPGKQADLVILEATDYRELAYYFGADHCRTVLKKGAVVYGPETPPPPPAPVKKAKAVAR